MMILLPALLVFLLALVNGTVSVEIFVKTEDSLYYDEQLHQNLSIYSLTEGITHVTASSDGEKRLLFRCDVSKNHPQIVQLIKDSTERVQVGDAEWSTFLQHCQELSNTYTVLSELTLKQTEHSIEKREVRPRWRTTLRPTYIPEGNKLGNAFISNGTVWCGTGNMAKSFDDLGYYSEVDKCCRSHDYCKDYIGMFSNKYNYNNNRPFTISRCECDYDFYGCLRRAKTEKAEEVGKLFFGTIGVPCFSIEYGEYCVESGFLGLSCNRREMTTGATINYVLSNIWKQEKLRVPLGP